MRLNFHNEMQNRRTQPRLSKQEKEYFEYNFKNNCCVGSYTVVKLLMLYNEKAPKQWFDPICRDPRDTLFKAYKIFLKKNCLHSLSILLLVRGRNFDTTDETA